MTGVQLQNAQWLPTLHLKCGRGGYGFDYVCVLDDRVEVHIRRPSRAQPQETTIHVGAQVFARGQWTAAAEALNKMDKPNG